MENTRLIVLLDCFFANSCSPTEKEELMQLLDSNLYDDAVKAYISHAWGKKELPHQLTGDQSDNILSAIFSRNNAAVVPLAKSSRFKQWTWAAAAVLLLALSTTAWFLFPGSLPQNKNVLAESKAAKPAKNDIAPGSDGAILTLADGSVIVLDSALDGNLAKQGDASILKTDGVVQYVSKTGETTAAVGFNTIGTPRGKQFKLVLEDGTKVWLNAASSIRFPTVFGKGERRVDITGEAYFEVAKNPNRPFTVSVNGMQVQVLGTHFNVNAYNDEAAIKTTLLEGSVKVVKDDKAKMLIPGQQANLELSGEMRVIKNVNTRDIVAWKNDLFSFDNTDIKNLLRQLSRWYDVQIVLPETMPAITITGTISRHSNLSDVLKMLELTGEVTFFIDGKNVIVKM